MVEDQLREGEGRSLFTLKSLLILVIGCILGYLIKGQAVQNVTMGYDDYKIIKQEDTIAKKKINLDNPENVDESVDSEDK